MALLPTQTARQHPHRRRCESRRRRNREEGMIRHFSKTHLSKTQSFRIVGLLGFTALSGLALALTLGTSRGQEARPVAAQAASVEEWKVDPMRGPVDLGLTDPSLVGAIDVHVHLDPDAPGTGGVIRALDVFDAAILAKARGMRGFVYKTHQDTGSA